MSFHFCHQEEHHQQFNYKQEFLALLRKHGVEYDEHYVLGLKAGMPPATRAYGLA
jgi:3-mercaptopyruvate sulfurtransferase SseA